MRYDAVLSVHTNELTCGVGRFNARLAERLGIAHASIRDARFQYPLLSVKHSELEDKAIPTWPMFDVLWHDGGEPILTAQAQRVFYATQTGCPSTLRGNVTRGSMNVLTFGFAHKFQTTHFQRLRTLLDRTREDYTVSLSTGIHEGSPWDVGFQENIALMRGVFGDRLRVLGFLGDDALVKELHECTACALFFEPAVRANNTTFWTAMEAGVPTVTNLDPDSPPELEHEGNVFDLKQLTAWPGYIELRGTRAAARRVAQRYDWDHLLKVLA